MARSVQEFLRSGVEDAQLPSVHSSGAGGSTGLAEGVKDSGGRSSGRSGETLGDERLKTSTNEPQGLNTSRRKSSERASDISPVAPPVTGVPSASPDEEKVIRDITPSGIVVEYQAKPKRLYRVNGIEVPSVTTVLQALAKDSLPWWAMQKGVEGVLELHKRNRLREAVTQLPMVVLETDDGQIATMENVVALLTAEKLTVNHRAQDAADRGVNVHDALELWAKTGDLPDPDDFGETERPYVTGLRSFLVESGAEPLATEVMVGSANYGFAGRYDLRLFLPKDRELVVYLTKKGRGDRTDTVKAGTSLTDLKTGKGVYPGSHFRQLAAYEAAGIECGYDATDAQYVIQVDAQGRYQFRKSVATFEDFLAVLRVHESNERLKAAA